MNVKDLRDKKLRAVEQAKSIMAAATEAGREMTADEARSFDKWMDEGEAYTAQIARAERLETEERALGESLGRRTLGTTLGTSNTGTDQLRSFLLGLNGAGREATFTLGSEGLRRLTDRTAWEARALATTSGPVGGHIVPRSFVAEVESAMLAFGGMRGVAQVLRTAGGEALPFTTENDTANEGAIVAEGASATEQDVAFSQLTLGAYKYSSKVIRVSMELLQDSAIDLPAFIGAKLGERIGRITNRHFTVGTGAGQPMGLVTAAASGIVGATGNATSITYDNLVNLQHSVDPAYRVRGSFMFNDTTLRELKKLKDGQNRPLWSAGMAVGEPDTILGQPYVVNQHMAPMAASAKSIIFGDLSKYIIRDVLDVQLVRLNELYALSGQVAFLAWSRHDGNLLDAGTNPVKFYQNSAT